MSKKNSLCFHTVIANHTIYFEFTISIYIETIYLFCYELYLETVNIKNCSFYRISVRSHLKVHNYQTNFQVCSLRFRDFHLKFSGSDYDFLLNRNKQHLKAKVRHSFIGYIKNPKCFPMYEKNFIL